MVKTSNQSYKIKLSVVTPTFIGCGKENNWMEGIDYVQKDGKIYVLDMDKVAKIVDVEHLASILFKGGREAESGLFQMIKGNLRSVLRYEPFDCPYYIDNVEKKYIKSSSSTVSAFIRSQFHNVPVIPGSSLKGAIRSILFKYLRKGERKEADVFGNLKNGCDFMRLISVGDTEIDTVNESGNTTVILNTKIFNLHGEGVHWKGGWKHAFANTTEAYRAVGFNTLYECAAPGASGSLVLSLKQNGVDLLKKATKDNFVSYEDKKRKVLSDIKELFGIINRHTREYIEKELDFFKIYEEAEGTDKIIENIKMLQDKIPSDNNSCLLKIGAGSGFHSITGDWQYEDYDDTGFDGKYDKKKDKTIRKKKYKSRKIVDYNDALSLMGFIELKIGK